MGHQVVRVALAGSSGSIGTQTLDVVRACNALGDGPRYEVVALGVGTSVDVMVEQALEFRPSMVAVADPARRAEVAQRLPFATVVDTFADLVENADVVVNGVVGFAGLPVTIETLRQGRRLALANKESLVVAGPLVVEAVRRHGGRIFPVDSEHSALWQCVNGEVPGAIRRLILTASGGPFRTWDADRIAGVTVADALRHPTWQMGPKITIDSATLMNKGLEAIEAHWMFGVAFDRIDVAVHPTSIVHSLDRKSTRLNSSHIPLSRMPSSA